MTHHIFQKIKMRHGKLRLVRYHPTSPHYNDHTLQGWEIQIE